VANGERTHALALADSVRERLRKRAAVRRDAIERARGERISRPAADRAGRDRLPSYDDLEEITGTALKVAQDALAVAKQHVPAQPAPREVSDPPAARSAHRLGRTIAAVTGVVIGLGALARAIYAVATGH
jgi:hypothetical protein